MTNLLPRLEFAVQSLVRRRRTCPHCRSARTELVARKRLVLRVRRCRECLLCFTDPLYESSVFGSLYDGLYEGEGSTTAQPARAELERLRRAGFAGSDKEFGARLELLLALAPGKRLLELGSSWGYFVHQARELGCEAVGVEIGRARREFGVRELGVPLCASLDELGTRRFDIVYAAHVLEHFTDLTAIFGELFARLVPGGLLALEVPHFDLVGRGRAALASIGAVHPLGFTPEFFTLNLPRHGFEPPVLLEHWEDARPIGALRVRAGGGARRPSGVVVVLARRPSASRLGDEP